MKEHPASMEKIFPEFWGTEPPARKNRWGTMFSYLFFEEACQLSYDKGSKDMLDQVMKWLDENITHYTDADYLGDCEPMSKLLPDLQQVMFSLQKREQHYVNNVVSEKKTASPIYWEQEQEIRKLKRELHEKDITIHNVIKKLKDHGIC